MSSSEPGETAPEEQPAPDLPGDTAAEALSLAASLGEVLAEIGRRLDAYSAFGRRSRRIIIALAVSFALDVSLTAVLGFTAFQAHSTADSNARLVQAQYAQQTASHAAQLAGCAGGNAFRASQVIIWRRFLALATAPVPGEPAEKIARNNKIAGGFLVYIAAVNRPVDCVKRYGK